jgi:hypothetical protein
MMLKTAREHRLKGKTLTLALLGLSALALGGCGTSSSTESVTATGDVLLPPTAPTLSLTPQGIKSFNFSWTDVADETEYRLLENPDSASGYIQVATLAADDTSHDFEVFLPSRISASYILQACNSGGCADSTAVYVAGTLAAAAGYVKASNTEADDQFGYAVAVSDDGNTLAVGAYAEAGNAVGIDSDETIFLGDQNNNDTPNGGAVYVYTRNGASWSQQAYVKSSNTQAMDNFGYALALSSDGNTLAVGAFGEDSNATGTCTPSEIGCDLVSQANNDTNLSGAVYVFTRNVSTWSAQAYVKASNTGALDRFGDSVALSDDGNTLAVGAYGEASNATGVGGDQNNNDAADSGAVYLFTRSGVSWSQQAYVKASNTAMSDRFGERSIALAGDGNTLAVGAWAEDSNATGICAPADVDCDLAQANNTAGGSGAVYLFTRSDVTWSQQAYVKASNTGGGDWFGWSLALSVDGNTLAVGANREGSNATGIDGAQDDNTEAFSGAAYLFTRSGASWSQQAYVKASNTGAYDNFGSSLALSSDGNTLAVGAFGEDGSATGIGGDQSNNDTNLSGAVYLFSRDVGSWSQQAYVKAPNTGAADRFGDNVALAGDGRTLAVGAYGEAGNTTGINGDQSDDSASNSGAVYLY